ncbi:DNA-binding beta-propeller fold protein YncE [Solirubrobacter pauli]|uniref:DNA-binding beta-propeller fold protein YncE n=1 Tax=Solirubrobacter pauli TaxID=166793 RepID=A0A660LG10_9ACTN|nr:DNA-binding beta-propeller fold protein YncE [Solirubrobacter pauli]
MRVGAGAEGIAVDPAGTVAAIATDDGLTLVDAGTGAVRETVRLPAAARHVSFSPRHGFLVPLEEANQLAEVSPDGGVRLIDTGTHPHDAAGDADGRVFVGDEFAASLSVVEAGATVRTVRVAEQPGGVAVTGDVVAVVSVRANVVEAYDRRTLERLSTQNVGYGPSHVVAGEDGRLYVADTRGGGISVFSTRPRLRFEQRIATPGKPYGVALDGARLWVTLSDRNQLLRIEGGRVVKRYPTVTTPYSVAVNPAGDVLVTGRDRGELQIVSP